MIHGAEINSTFGIAELHMNSEDILRLYSPVSARFNITIHPLRVSPSIEITHLEMRP